MVLAIIVSNTFVVISKLCLKKKATEIKDLNNDFLMNPLGILFSPWVLTAMVCFAISLFLSIYIYTKLEVSKVFPISFGFGFAVLAISSYYIFNEKFTYINFIGVLVIFIGSYLVLHKESLPS